MTDNNALAQELDTIIDQAIGDAEDHITMSFDTAEAILAALRTAGEVGHKRDHGPSCCCDGRECGCAATSVRELWSWHVNQGPKP